MSLLNPRVERRVTAVRKATHGLLPPTWHSITHLKADGVWYTKEQVIADIESRRYAYYTNEDGTKAYLEVVASVGLAPPYLRTDADCSRVNNLLELPPD